jgi:hypothetical protein
VRDRGEQLAGDLLPHAPLIIAVFDLEIGLQEVDERPVGGGLAV